MSSVIIPRNAPQVSKLSATQVTELYHALLTHLNTVKCRNHFLQEVDVQRSILAALISQLDDLDCDDTFGTEGWRHALMGEDA